MKIGIYIPTLGRVNRQKTLENFEGSNYRPILVCSKEEQKELKSNYKKTRTWICPERGIGKVRQWILENSTEDAIFLVDDDMRFFERYRGKNTRTGEVVNWRLRELSPPDKMIEYCVEQINQGYIHGGVSARQGNNHVPTDVSENKRCFNFHFLNRKEVLKTGARFDMLPVMEDFYFTLSLLTRGYPNAVVFKYTWNQEPGSIGGCNLYRTLEVQDKAARQLHEAFPEFVTVVKKFNKTNNSIAQGERTDVRVQWVKAYRSSQDAV